jgi:hypothetical protein
MIRERDKDLPCILAEYNDCDPRDERECRHFIEREREPTRYHPFNLNSESKGCNKSHVSGYRPDKGVRYGLAIDQKWGAGVALFLYRLAHPLHEKNAIPRDESWSVNELNTIKDAARRGSRIYEAVYFDLRPLHRP